MLQPQGCNAAGKRGPHKMKKACGDAGPPELARPEGFEPPTPWFVAKYSIQMSYGRLRGRIIAKSFLPSHTLFGDCIWPARCALVSIQLLNNNGAQS